jgi:hypothetical protein
LKDKVSSQNDLIIELEERNNQLEREKHILENEVGRLENDLKVEKELSQLWENRSELFLNEIEFYTYYTFNGDVKLNGGLNGAMREISRLHSGMCTDCKRKLILNLK